MRSVVTRVVVGILCGGVILAAPVTAGAQYGATNGEWRSYGGDLGSTKYSPLDQIDATNFADLRVAWRWQSADGSLDLDTIRETVPRIQFRMFQATPLMVDGVLYISTALHQVAAVDAASGETLWVHDPEAYLGGRPTHFYNSRGVAYWSDDRPGIIDARIFFGTNAGYLIALDASTGDPVLDFGEEIVVRCWKGLFQQAYVHPRQGVAMGFHHLGAPTLIGIQDQAGVGGVLAHGGNPLQIAASGKLNLEEGVMAVTPCRGGHVRGCVQAESERGLHRLGVSESRQLPHRHAFVPGLQVPEGAVDGVARRPRGQKILQGGAVQSIDKGSAQGLDGRHHAIDGLVVTGIGHALPPAPDVSVLKFDDDYICGGLGASGDGKGTGYGPALAPYDELSQAAASAGMPGQSK